MLCSSGKVTVGDADIANPQTPTAGGLVGFMALAALKPARTVLNRYVRPKPGDFHPKVEGWMQRDVAVELFKAAGLDFEAEKKKARKERKDFSQNCLKSNYKSRFTYEKRKK